MISIFQDPDYIIHADSPIGQSRWYGQAQIRLWNNALFSWEELQSHIANGLQDGKADIETGGTYDYFYNL